MRSLLYLVIAAFAVLFLFVGVKIQNSPFAAETISLFKETFGTREPIAEIEIAGSDSAIPSEMNPQSSPKNEAASKAISAQSSEKNFSKISSSGVLEAKVCSATTTAPTHAALINEVAWAGTASDKTANEWVELKNNLGKDIHLNGWQLMNKSGDLKIFFGSADILREGSYFLLERGDDGTLPNITADKVFTGTIKNSDEALRLWNVGCELVDEVLADVGTGNAWPAGTASPQYRSAERSLDFSWHTFSGMPFGGVNGTPNAMNSTALDTGPLPQAKDPVVSQSQTQTNASSNTGQGNSSTLPLVSEIMVGIDGNAGYEFIELYNSGSQAISLTGWSIKKKSSTGSESSLVAASRLEGKTIPAGKYFLLAHGGDYTGPVTADIEWPLTYELAYSNNGIVLMNGSTRVEEIIWTEIPKGKSFVRTSWNSNQFTVTDTPTPQNSQ